MVIALDGPAGAGKSTVCRLLAKELGCTCLDTGAMYRAVAWVLFKEGVRSENDPRIPGLLDRPPLSFAMENGELAVSCGHIRLGEELRHPDITRWASLFSRNEAVRSFLTQQQRALAQKGDLVAEGRDMTTVVFPDAYVKIFLTADLATRAKRRFKEYQQKGIQVDYASLESQIRSRDEADRNRALAPLRPAPDALLLDTSELEPAEVVIRILELIERKNEKIAHERCEKY